MANNFALGLLTPWVRIMPILVGKKVKIWKNPKFFRKASAMNIIISIFAKYSTLPGSGAQSLGGGRHF